MKQFIILLRDCLLNTLEYFRRDAKVHRAFKKYIGGKTIIIGATFSMAEVFSEDNDCRPRDSEIYYSSLQHDLMIAEIARYTIKQIEISNYEDLKHFDNSASGTLRVEFGNLVATKYLDAFDPNYAVWPWKKKILQLKQFTLGHKTIEIEVAFTRDNFGYYEFSGIPVVETADIVRFKYNAYILNHCTSQTLSMFVKTMHSREKVTS